MTKNPIINALIAVLYIAAVVSAIFYVSPLFPDTDGTILAPMAMLSLLTLSVAMMCLTFFYNPVALLIKGEQAHAFKLLAQTIAYFAAIAAISVTLFSAILL